MGHTNRKLRFANLLAVIGTVTFVAVLIVIGCATGRAKQGVNSNKVSAQADVKADATIEAPITLDANATVRADITAMKAEIGEIRASLVGPVNVGPIGGNHAGGDLQTVDSLTSQILARAVASTVKWSVLISIITVALYVLCHRFRSTRKVLDFCKGSSDAPRAPHVRALEHFFRGGCKCRYVDAVNGDDTNDGLTPQTAWKTFPKHFAGGANAGDTDDRGLAGP